MVLSRSWQRMMSLVEKRGRHTVRNPARTTTAAISGTTAHYCHSHRASSGEKPTCRKETSNAHCSCTDRWGHAKTMYASKKEAWYYMRLAALGRPASLLFPHRCRDYADKWHITQQGPWHVYEEARRRDEGDSNLVPDRRSTTCRGARTGEFLVQYDTREQAERGIVYVKHRYRHDMKAYQCKKCNSWHLAPEEPPPHVFHHEHPMSFSRPARRTFSATPASSVSGINEIHQHHNTTRRNQSCMVSSSSSKWWVFLLLSSSVSLQNVTGFSVTSIPYLGPSPRRSTRVAPMSNSFRTPFFASTPHDSLSWHRLFSSRDASNQDEWKVPSTVRIPEESLDMSFVRSSGAGGQNVNKVSTSVQIKVLVDGMGWIPYEVRDRLKQNEAKRINKEGYLVFQVQEYRTQAQNRKAAVDKLREMILLAWPRPKQRKMRTGLSPKTKKQRREHKRKRSMVKEGRRKVDF